MNEVEIERLADEQDNVGVAPNKTVGGGMGIFRVLQHANPLRFAIEIVGEEAARAVRCRLAVLLDGQQVAIGFKSAVAIEVNPETKVRREDRIGIGLDENGRARVEKEIGDILRPVRAVVVGWAHAGAGGVKVVIDVVRAR